jgi:DNA-binding response OmpR family regulator
MPQSKKNKNIKILVVDEDKQFTDEITKFLELKHFKYIISNEVSAGVLMLLEHEFDIVVLDIDLLKSLGNDVVEFLAVVRKLNGQKLILTTNLLPTTQLVMSMLENDIDSFVAKPLKMQILCDIISGKNGSSTKISDTLFVN